LVLIALVMSAARLPATVCPVASLAIGQACHGCCKNKKCCADSQKNQRVPATPIAKDGSGNHELTAVVAQGVAARPLEFVAPEISRAIAICVAHSPPSRAVLCTFLI